MAEGGNQNITVSTQVDVSRPTYEEQIRRLTDILHRLNEEKDQLSKGKKKREVCALLEKTKLCIAVKSKKQRGEGCSSNEEDYNYDDDEIEQLDKQSKKAIGKANLTRSSNDTTDGPILRLKVLCEPSRHRHKLAIKSARVLVLANTKFPQRLDKDRPKADEYPSIRRFIYTFGYVDVLELILTNITILHKMNFENITIENAHDRNFKKVTKEDIAHLNKMTGKYKQLRDKMAENNAEINEDLDNDRLVGKIEKLSWSKEQMDIILDILIEDPPGRRDVDALMIFVCSHGRTDDNGKMEIEDSLWQPIKVNAIIEKLSKMTTPCNMLFISACRGEKTHKNEAVVVNEQTNKQESAGGDHLSGTQTTERTQPGSTGRLDTATEHPATDHATTDRTTTGRPVQEASHTEGQSTFTPQTEQPNVDVTQAIDNLSIRGASGDGPQDSNEDVSNAPNPLPRPALIGARPKDPKPLPLHVESTGNCPNDCLVLYTTTRDFFADVDPQYGNIFVFNFAQKLGELVKRSNTGIALLPFLLWLTGDLAREDESGDLQMLTFDHALCEMPVLFGNADD